MSISKATRRTAPAGSEASADSGTATRDSATTRGSTATHVPAHALKPSADRRARHWPWHLRWRWPSPGRLVVLGIVAAAVIGLFLCYLRMSASVPENSDGAANALQAWDVLHGNVLLTGWQLSDVSFYTTELPEYALIELIHGLNAQVENIAGALTYTLLVLSAALLAKGRASGKLGWTRMLVAAGIMVSPQLAGVGVLMLQPDHVGSSVPVLLTWLVLDRGGRRWWVPVAMTLLLAWSLVADPIVLYIGIVPLLGVAVMRAYRQILHRDQPGGAAWYSPIRAAWFELALAAAAIVATVIGIAVPVLIRAAGGYLVATAPHSVAPSSLLGTHLRLLFEGVLLLFGADVFGMTLSRHTGLALVHLVGLALAIWGLCAGLRRFVRTDDWIVQLLVIGSLIVGAGYLFGTYAVDVSAVHEMSAVLPFGAVLAGRLLAGRLISARLLPAAAAVMALYLVTLGTNVVSAQQSNAALSLPRWLSAHHLSYGLGSYWSANSVTLASGNRIMVRAINGRARPHRYAWESNGSWYDPRLHNANFIVNCPQQPATAVLRMRSVYQLFGPPAHSYTASGCQVLIYNYNLLAVLAGGSAARASPATR